MIFIIFRSHFRHGFRNAPLVHRYWASDFRNAKEELVVISLVVVRSRSNFVKLIITWVLQFYKVSAPYDKFWRSYASETIFGTDLKLGWQVERYENSKIDPILGFACVFNRLYLRAQREFGKDLGHFRTLRVEPVSTRPKTFEAEENWQS